MSGKPIPAEKMPRVIGTTFPTPMPPDERDFPGSRDPADDPLGLYRAPGELPAPDPHQAYTTVDRIKCYIRTLTHREMRELAADLFGAYERLHPQVDPTVIKAAIPREALAEVLDRFAHND